MTPIKYVNADELWVRLTIWISENFPGLRCVDLRGKLPSRPLDGSGYKRIDIRRRLGVCFHHAAGWGEAREYAHTHMERWSSAAGIAYSMGIQKDGTIELYWDLDIRTYSHGWTDDPAVPQTLGDENTKWLGVLIHGFFRSPDYQKKPAGEPTWDQMVAMLAVAEFFRLAEMPEVTGHYEHGKPACPGTTLQTMIKAIKFNTPKIVSMDFSTVELRQRALAELGFYTAVVDGIWGPKSLASLEAFQKSARINPDGLWGPVTEAAVAEALRNQ